MSSLTVQTRSRMKNYLNTKLFSVNWETTTLLIKTSRIIKIWGQVELIRSKCYKNFKSSQYPHLVGIKNIWQKHLAGDLAETWNEYIYRFFAVVQQQRCCSNPWSNAKKGSVLSSERNLYVRTWMYSSKFGKYLLLHKSTNEKFYTFYKSGGDLCEKIREDMTGEPSIVFTRKAVVDKTFIRDSSNVCKSIVGIGASQLYPYSMCQDMITGLYTRWEFDSDMQKLKARHNRSPNFENMFQCR